MLTWHDAVISADALVRIATPTGVSGSAIGDCAVQHSADLHRRCACAAAVAGNPGRA